MTIRFRIQHLAKLRRLARHTVTSIVACLVLLGSVALYAQDGGYDKPGHGRQERDGSDSDRPDNGVSAGGKWTEYRSEDRMTAAHRVRFELSADNAEDNVDQARILLYCTDGKLNLADFRPNVRLGRPDWPGFWGQPQMRVTVRVDGAHSHHNWNWVNGHFLSIDKGTTRELIGAHLFRVEFQTPDGPRIAEFSPSGLNLNVIKNACGLTPKKQ